MLDIKYDSSRGVVEINGTKYAEELFEEFGMGSQVGQVLEIVKKGDGVVTIHRHDLLEQWLRQIRDENEVRHGHY